MVNRKCVFTLAFVCLVACGCEGDEPNGKNSETAGQEEKMQEQVKGQVRIVLLGVDAAQTDKSAQKYDLRIRYFLEILGKDPVEQVGTGPIEIFRNGKRVTGDIATATENWPYENKERWDGDIVAKIGVSDPARAYVRRRTFLGLSFGSGRLDIKLEEGFNQTREVFLFNDIYIEQSDLAPKSGRAPYE